MLPKPHHRRRAFRRILILTLVLGSPTAGGAAEHPIGPAETSLRASCADDYRRLCADIHEDSAAIEACFRQKLGQVSLGYQEAAVEFGGRAKAELAAR